MSVNRHDHTADPPRYPDYHLHAEELASHARTHAGSRGLRALANANDAPGVVTADAAQVTVNLFALGGPSLALAHMVLHDLVLALVAATIVEYDDATGRHCRDFDGDLMTGRVHVHTDADDAESCELAGVLRGQRAA